MTKLPILTSIAVLLGLGSCSKPAEPEVARAETPATPQVPLENLDACSLLTSAEIDGVQGDSVTGTTPSGGTLSGLPSTQCVFQTATPANSVSVVVTRSSGSRRVADFWKKTFHREESEKEGEEESEERENKAPPQPVPDLGEEAFWIGTQVSSALYVLKGESYLRISVGGAGDQAAKLAKSKTLAEFALKRL